MQLRQGSAMVAAVITAFGVSACASTSGPKGASHVAVTLQDSGCTPDQIHVAAGPVTFAVTNGGTSEVSEMELKNRSGIILGESENVVEGVPGHFSLYLQPGQYIVNCPTGSTSDQGKLVATGTATAGPRGASAVLLTQATTAYQAYVEHQVTALQRGTAQFTAALARGELERAEALFGPVRTHYEAIEPVAESFGNLDPDIDARVNDVSSIGQWHGFHHIEQILWVRHTTVGTAGYAARLTADVNTLAAKVKTIQLQPAQLANGAVELMNEVATSKITGEEDRYSHTDLSDFEANLAGSRQAFDLLVPALRQTGNGALATTIETRFAAVQTTLDKYRRATPLGFALYTGLSEPDKRTLAVEVDALAEPLAGVAAKVSGA